MTAEVTDALGQYRFADATRTLYDFAWDEFCSFYIEMLKERLRDEQTRHVAQTVATYALDQL